MSFNNEIIGIIGTLLILVGFCSDKERIIRIFDMAGSILFIIYGVFIGSISTILLNSVLVMVHTYKFYRGRKLKGANAS